MPLAIDSESSPPVETPFKTNEDGRVERLIRSSDTVTISSLYPAIAFTPVSGQAMELFLGGDVPINAQRLVEQSGACRQLNDEAKEEVVYKFFNITDTTLTIEIDENLNTLVYPDGTPLAVPPPQTFASGQGEFVIPLEEFRSPEMGRNTIAGNWKFLASESVFSFQDRIEQNPLPVCEGAIVGPCSPLDDSTLKTIADRTTSEPTSLFNYSTRITKKIQKKSARLPYIRTGAVALRNIRSLASSLRGKTFNCGIAPYRCRQAPFPRIVFEKHFETIFSSQPPAKQKEFRKYGNGAIKRFRAFMAKNFPQSVYICE